MIGEEERRIIEVYVRGDIKEKLEKLRRWMDGEKEERVMIGGNFNSRTREWDGKVGE